MEEERFDQRVQLVTSRKLMLAVDDWRRAQGDIPSRSEAIRRLIELGLKAMPEPVSVEGLVDHYRRVGRPDLADVVELGLKDMKS